MGKLPLINHDNKPSMLSSIHITNPDDMRKEEEEHLISSVRY